MLSAVFEWLKTVIIMAGYVSGNTAFPSQLSAEEENFYLQRLKDGDENAKNTLIEHNLRLVAHISRKYSDDRNGEDLISIGTIGLIKAINTFNPSKNKKLSSYAARCIENEVLMYLRSAKRQRHEVYIDDSIGTDHDGNPMTLADILPSNDKDISDEVSDNIEISKLYKLMQNILSPDEYLIICRRYGLFSQRRYTQQEIADSLGISRSYVSRIEKRCLQKLKEAFL